MRRYSVRITGAAVAALVLVSSVAGAQGKGRGHGDGKDKGKSDDVERVHTSTGDVIRDRDGRIITRDGRIITRDGDERRGRDGDERRDRDGDGRFDRGRRVPPGLAKKPGQMPPGQFKKRYGTNDGASVLGDIFRRNGYTVVRVVPTGQAQYVYYRLRDGQERRAIVSPGTDRLGFSNVPATLLQQVLAALYR